jgi:glycosyltransferase involved in cell wall biosynthesis
MNVLHVVANIDPKAGGLSQAVRTIIKGLADFGVYSHVVSVDEPGTILLEDVSITCLGPGIGLWKYSKKLYKWLSEHIYDFECVIVHGLWVYPSYVISKFTSARNERAPKVFVMPHGMLDPYFQKAKGRRLKAVRNWIYWKIIEKNLINKSAAILFTCETEKRLASKSFKPYKPKSEVIVGLGVERPPLRNSVMMQAFFRESRLNTDSYWLFISRIHEKKGIHLLIDAYLLLKRQGRELPKLVIAGPGHDTEYGRKLKRKINGDKDVILCGMLTGDKKWGALYNAEAFVLPSHQENFGIAVVEAMACGKPVLISDQVNIFKEIQLGGGGIVGKDSVAGVYGMLKQWLLKEKGDKMTMGEGARKVFEEHFSVREASKRLFLVLHRACKRHSVNIDSATGYSQG